jgi:hypothetical protein
MEYCFLNLFPRGGYTPRKQCWFLPAISSKMGKLENIAFWPCFIATENWINWKNKCFEK